MNLRKIQSSVIFITPIVFFLLLFRKINIYQFIESLKGVDLSFLLLAMVISIFVKVCISSAQWLRILRPLNCRISFKEAVFVKVGSRPVKSVLPFYGGELLRAYYLKRRKGFPASLGISSLVIQFMFDFCCLIIIMGLAYLIFIRPSFASLSLLSVLLLYVFCIFAIKHIKKFILNFAKRVNLKLHTFISTLFNAYAKFKLKDLVAIAAYSIIIWIGELLTFIVIFRAVGLSIPLYAVLIFVPLVILISVIPITVSGLGTREAALVFFFYQFGSAEKLLSSGVLISFVQVIWPFIFSLFFMKSFLSRLYYHSEA